MDIHGIGTRNCLLFAILREPTKRQSSATRSRQDDFLLADDRKTTNAVFFVHLRDTKKCRFKGYRGSTATLDNLPNDKQFINMTYLWHVFQCTHEQASSWRDRP
jgi:hypothetical protein